MDGTAPRRTASISQSSQKGGVGKTTTTLNLGAQLAFWGSSVCIVDFDPQGQATAGLGLGVPLKQHTICTALQLLNLNMPVDLATLLVDRTSLVRDAGGSGSLAVIGTNTESMQELMDWVVTARRDDESLLSATTVLRRFVDEYLADYDYVLFDTPPTTNALNALALAASDYVIGVAESKYASYSGIVALYGQTQLMPSKTNDTCHPHFLGTLLNETPYRETSQGRHVRLWLGGTEELEFDEEGEFADPAIEEGEHLVPSQSVSEEEQLAQRLAVFNESIGASEFISSSFAKGQPAVLLHPNRPLAEQYGNFAGEVFQRIAQHRELTGVAAS